MKELSIEEKAKAYDEAFERAKGMWEQGMMPERIEYIFPELKESEDEKIRKAIFKSLSKKDARDVLLANGIQVSDALSWLENQKSSNMDNDLQEYKEKLEKIINESILFHFNSEHYTQVTRNSDLGAIGTLISLKVSLGFSLFHWERLMYEGQCLPF